IVALQVATGAHISISEPADEWKHVSESEVASAVLSKESGVPLKQVQEDMEALSKTVKEGEGGNLFARIGSSIADTGKNFLRWMYVNEPGKQIARLNREEVKIMMQEYEQESKKRLYSSVDVNFTKPDFVPNRAYYVGDPTDAANRRHLDASQQQYLQNLSYVGKTTEGGTTRMLTRMEIDRTLKKMAYAQQNAYFVKYDKQLRTESDLNLIQIENGEMVVTGSRLGNVAVGENSLGNINMLPVGLNERAFSLNSQLEHVMMAIQKDVSMEIRNTNQREATIKAIESKVITLQESISEKKLSDADQQVKERQESNKARAESEITIIETHEDLEKQKSAKQNEITVKEAEVQPGTQAESDLKTKESEKTTKEKDLKNKADEITRIEAQISSLEARKSTRLQEIVELKQKRRDRDSQLINDNRRKAAVNAEITSLGSSPPSPQVNINIAALQSELQQLDRRISDHPQDIADINADITAKENDINDPTNGIEAQITTQSTNFSTKQGEKVTIENDIKTLNTDIADLTAKIESYKEGLSQLQALEKELEDLDAKQKAEYVKLTGINSAIYIASGSIPAYRKDILKQEVKSAEKIIEQFETNLG
ncbi:MAG TPA: hypothetical protein PLS49_07115, partial [Candidatus Woesebacteria bacterium]|nr:hypothetical protein [Candidatus Woesebacteria bacterium]